MPRWRTLSRSALYWSSATKYQPVQLYTDPVWLSTNQYHISAHQGSSLTRATCHFFCGVTNFCQHISLNFLQHQRPFEDILTRCFVFHPSDFPEEVLKAPPDTAAATRWWSSDVNGSLLSPSFPEVKTLKKPGVKLLELPFFCPHCFPLKKLPKVSLHFIVHVYFLQLEKI